jgi:hypothetical protein
VNPRDPFESDGAGLDPGAIPPVPEGFTGELKCVQTDPGGVPFPGNALKGDAVLVTDSGEVSKYNAISILATGSVSGEPVNEIRLDNTPNEDGEANSCYATNYLNHFAAGAKNPMMPSLAPGLCSADPNTNECPIQTELTMVPCSQDLENIIPGEVTVQFLITNEFENSLSYSTTVECWFNESLYKIGSTTGTGPFSYAVLGSLTAFTSITPVEGDGGVMAVAEEFHTADPFAAATAAWDLQAEGEYTSGRFLPRTRYDASLSSGSPVVDVIVIPEGL